MSTYCNLGTHQADLSLFGAQKLRLDKGPVCLGFTFIGRCMILLAGCASCVLSVRDDTTRPGGVRLGITKEVRFTLAGITVDNCQIL